MLTCRELTDFLSAYLAGEISAAQRVEFERHLAVCPACVRYLHTFEQTVALGKAAYRTGEGSNPRTAPGAAPRDRDDAAPGTDLRGGAGAAPGAAPCGGPDADTPAEIPEDLIKAILAARRK